jgi:hypothetical protein
LTERVIWRTADRLDAMYPEAAYGGGAFETAENAGALSRKRPGVGAELKAMLG